MPSDRKKRHNGATDMHHHARGKLLHYFSMRHLTARDQRQEVVMETVCCSSAPICRLRAVGPQQVRSLGQFHPTDAWKNNEVARPVRGDLGKLTASMCDNPLRKGICGLKAICQQKLLCDPFSGAIFAFTNRARTSVKLLVYDASVMVTIH